METKDKCYINNSCHPLPIVVGIVAHISKVVAYGKLSSVKNLRAYITTTNCNEDSSDYELCPSKKKLN
jgi:hypothetical protein